MNDDIIKTDEDLKILLDKFINSRNGEWWDNFYADRSRNIPFFVSVPDENLVQYVEKNHIRKGKALDIGCGNGRNSLYLAENGFKVTGIDFSSEAIDYARKYHAHNNIRYENISFFDFENGRNEYDFIYDGGCLHHISPHRRPDYLKKIKSLLDENGRYGMEVFNEKGGADLSDFQVYTVRSMKGGIAFSGEKLNKILSEYFNIIEFREMKEVDDGTAFGKSFCQVVLMENK